jgi:hypothetical protein
MKKIIATLLLSLPLITLAAQAGAAERELPAVPVAVTEPGDDIDLCIGENLLENPSFEGEYASYVPPEGHPDCPADICTTAQMAPGWTPWWRSNSGLPDDYDRNPEYKATWPADLGATGPGDRVRSGVHAQQYFSFYGTHIAGVYQQVPVTPGRTYRFCIWGHSWSAGEYVDYYENPPTIPDIDYVSGPQFGIMMQRVGIDPLGGTEWPVDGTGENIVWGPAREQYDYWGQFSVEIAAEAETLTVYTLSDPMWAVRNNDVYWDDAALVELADATMTVTPETGLVFLADVDDPRAQSRRLQVGFNPDNGYEWTALVSSGSTLVPTVSPLSGDSAVPLEIAVDSAGLGVGTYTAAVTVSATDGAIGGSPVDILVTLHVVGELSEFYLPIAVLRP